MAREDLLPQLLRELTQKEGPPAPDDNTLIQKMVAPNDSAQAADDAPAFSKLNPATFVWGGEPCLINFMGTFLSFPASFPGWIGWSQQLTISAGWKWGQGQWH